MDGTAQSIRRVWENRKIMMGSALAHFTHDGFVDMLYVFFPIWQAQFAMSFAQVGFFKMLNSGTMAFLQVPSSFLARRMGSVRLLLAGTLTTSLAVTAYGWAWTPPALGCLLVLAGLGASVQHPLSSTLISSACADKELRRTALSIFNMSGDIGKLVFPAAAALIISRFSWPAAGRTLGLFGVAVTVLLVLLTSSIEAPACVEEAGTARAGTGNSIWKGNRAFSALVMIGILDSATRMGYLTYFPFLLRDKGASIALTGFALSLIFAGGIAGKFVCGVLATRVGVLRSVLVTEGLTALLIWISIFLPLGAALAMCPVLGIALNGTSSVLYGSVPELVPEEKQNESFAVFYTATIGSGAVSPFIYGFCSDLAGLKSMLLVVGMLVLATLPLTLPLRGKLDG